MNNISKKIISIITIFFIAMTSVTACGSGSEAIESDDSGKITVVASIFPVYDWVKNIIGDSENIEVSLLSESGADMHSYEPTAEDMLRVSNSDVFIYVGGESEDWVDDALSNASNSEMTTLNLMEVLGDDLKVEEVKEGMEAEEEEEDGESYDEHVWMSPSNASVYVAVISDILSEKDPDNAGLYAANATSYIDSLLELATEYQNVVESASTKTILLADRFPLRYLVDEFGIDYYAAFVGCSAETEASFETLSFLSEKLDELDLEYVLVLESSDEKMAKTIIENSDNKDRKIEKIDSMQSVSKKDIEEGVTYLSAMEDNLDVLKTVMN